VCVCVCVCVFERYSLAPGCAPHCICCVLSLAYAHNTPRSQKTTAPTHWCCADEAVCSVSADARDLYTEKIIYTAAASWTASADPGLSDRDTSVRARFGIPLNSSVYGNLAPQSHYTRSVFQTWCEIVGRVPGAHLVLVTPDHVKAAENIKRVWSHMGLAHDRLHLVPRRAAAALLDVGLSVGGDSETLALLFASVPVVHWMSGQKMAQHAGASLLHAAGLPDLVAKGVDDYINMAVRLGTDTAFHNKHRLQGGLNATRSVLVQNGVVAASIAHGLRQAYLQWWQGRTPTDIDSDDLVVIMDSAEPDTGHLATVAYVTEAAAAPSPSPPAHATSPPAAAEDNPFDSPSNYEAVDILKLNGWWDEERFFQPVYARSTVPTIADKTASKQSAADKTGATLDSLPATTAPATAPKHMDADMAAREVDASAAASMATSQAVPTSGIPLPAPKPGSTTSSPDRVAADGHLGITPVDILKLKGWWDEVRFFGALPTRSTLSATATTPPTRTSMPTIDPPATTSVLPTTTLATTATATQRIRQDNAASATVRELLAEPLNDYNLPEPTLLELQTLKGWWPDDMFAAGVGTILLDDTALPPPVGVDMQEGVPVHDSALSPTQLTLDEPEPVDLSLLMGWWPEARFVGSTVGAKPTSMQSAGSKGRNSRLEIEVPPAPATPLQLEISTLEGWWPTEKFFE
jgi:hypothetical protein